MLSALVAFWHSVLYYRIIHLTIVRRYVDAQSNFIGELYMGNGRDAKMIGMSCDSFPFNNEGAVRGQIDFKHDFTEPMGANVIRVGGQEPAENATVRSAIALVRYCPMTITILNRFVEHVLEKDCARK